MKRLILIDHRWSFLICLLGGLIYTIPEAVEKTGKSRATLYRWRKQGLIKFERVGRNVYISQKEIGRVNNGNV